jgi:ABC-type transporter Mla subunit MlaD
LKSCFILFPLSNTQVHNKWYQSRVPATMAEGTRVSQLAEALTKLHDECKAENQKVSQISEAFNKHQAYFNKHQEEFSKHQTKTKEYQTKTEESLSAILETLTTIAPDYVPPNKVMVQGETSGENSTVIPPMTDGMGILADQST